MLLAVDVHNFLLYLLVLMRLRSEVFLYTEKKIIGERTYVRMHLGICPNVTCICPNGTLYPDICPNATSALEHMSYCVYTCSNITS